MQRTENPFALVFVFRLTVELDEFRFRFQADEPLSSDDQKLPLEPRLLKDPLVLRLPARRPDAKVTV